MATIYWEEYTQRDLNHLIHRVFGRDPEQECYGHFEQDGWDEHGESYRCPLCLYRVMVPTSHRALTSTYLRAHTYVPDYVGSYEGAALVFQSMRIDRETREEFHKQLQQVFEIPLKPNTDVVSALSLAFSLGPELFTLVAIAALRTVGYKVIRRERRVA